MGTSEHRGRSAALAVVLVALALGAVVLAIVHRAGSADGAAGAEGCAAAGGLDPSAVVAIVDSGIDRSALPSDTVTGTQIDRAERATGELAPHGTEMASIVAERAPDARLLDVRVLDEHGSGEASSVAAGIDAARRSGADIINLSAAVAPSDPEIRAAIDRAVADGMVVVIAAGNDARDLSRDPAWRSLAAQPCVVVVGALDDGGDRLGSSNRGEGVIDVWTDGQDVAATKPGGGSTAVTGTSPAAATVTADVVSG